jgi:hypothetical protein
MDSFNALQIEEPDGRVVSGFVHLDESRLDFCNVARRAVYSRVDDIGVA